MTETVTGGSGGEILPRDYRAGADRIGLPSRAHHAALALDLSGNIFDLLARRRRVKCYADSIRLVLNSGAKLWTVGAVTLIHSMIDGF